MEASKITISDKTYDLNHLNRKRKTDLRRKLVIELIQSKPAGTVIKMQEVAEVCRFKQRQGADALIAKMIRDGVIGRYESEKKNRYYYAVIGSIRTRKPATEQRTGSDSKVVDFTDMIENLNRLGLTFSITISNKGKND